MTLIAKYRGLPRSIRWAIWGLATLAGFFIVVEPIRDSTLVLSERADAIERILASDRAINTGTAGAGGGGATGDAGVIAASFGTPLMPTDPKARPENLHRVVDEILRRNGVRDRTKQERRSPLRTESAARLVGDGSRVERISLELTFECEPRVFTAVLADLEQAREVSAVARVRIDKQSRSQGLIRATVVPEAWVLARAAAEGGER